MITNVRVRVYTFFSILFISASAMGWSQQVQNQSANDSAIKNVDVSILPFINVNSSPTAGRANISLNIFAGYKQEVRKFEAGTLLNIVKDDVASCQLSGIGNLVLGTSKGFQAAGTFNIDRKASSVQLAGVINATSSYSGPCQLAGVANVVGDTASGVQAAGTINIAKTARGCQLAGILNVVLNDAGKCQMAGVANFAGGNMTGFQMAGIANYAQSIHGTQLSGIINMARYVNGVQLSVINISDSCQGVPIGVFSWVRKGYHKLEFSTDELYFANLSLRTGTTSFHNNFLVGLRPDDFNNPLWTIGYGVGTSFKRTSRLSFDIDLSSRQIFKGHEFNFNNHLYNLYAGADFGLSSGSSIAAGICLNALISDTDSPQYEKTFSKLAPYSFINTTFHHNYNLKSWIGVKIAFRFM